MTVQTRLTNSQTANHEKWLVRCFPHALGYSREQSPCVFLSSSSIMRATVKHAGASHSDILDIDSQQANE